MIHRITFFNDNGWAIETHSIEASNEANALSEARLSPLGRASANCEIRDPEVDLRRLHGRDLQDIEFHLRRFRNSGLTERVEELLYQRRDLTALVADVLRRNRFIENAYATINALYEERLTR